MMPLTWRNKTGLRRLLMRVLVVLSAGLGLPALSYAQEIWFAPTDNLPRGSKLYNQDFPRLFDNPPTWNTRIDVFQISPFYAASATDENLLRITSFLKQHNIALAVGVQSVAIGNECALGEGLTHRGANLAVFRRLRRLALDVKYVGLDEPLTFGHYFDRGTRACRFPIAEVAKRVAETIAEIRQSYPNVRVVDYEAPGIAPASTWPADLASWIEDYGQATDSPFYSVVFDVDWRSRWIDWVRPAVAVLHHGGVKASMFLSIAGPGSSDAGAVASLRANILAVDAAHLPLDMVIVACWTPYPSRSVPASDPNTLTSVLDWYLARRGRG